MQKINSRRFESRSKDKAMSHIQDIEEAKLTAQQEAKKSS
jgi:hypothetical protein